MTGPSGNGCAHSSSDLDWMIPLALSTAALSEALASASELTVLTLRSWASKSMSNPPGRKAPSKNQSMVCAGPVRADGHAGRTCSSLASRGPGSGAHVRGSLRSDPGESRRQSG